MEHDAPIMVQLDEEPAEDTIVEPPADLVAFMAQKKEEESKVQIPAPSEIPQGMKAVHGKKIIVNKRDIKSKKKGMYTRVPGQIPISPDQGGFE